MKQTIYAVQYLSASVLVGILYGAIAGATFGVIAGLAGIIFGLSGGVLSVELFAIIPLGMISGLILGGISGVLFGVIGGAAGGRLGWSLAGFVGGLMAWYPLTHKRADDFYTLSPAFILASVGFIIALRLRKEEPKLPLLQWQQDLHGRADLLHGLQKVRLVLALLAILLGTYILQERFTASAQPSGGLFDSEKFD